VAAISLDAFHRHADKIVMGNIAQTINVLQAMILTDDEKMLVTPTFHVFDLYQAHRNGTSVRLAMRIRRTSSCRDGRTATKDRNDQRVRVRS